MNQREQNLATLKDYCARMIKGDFSALDEIMSPDWYTHASPRIIHEAFLGVTKAYEAFLRVRISCTMRVRMTFSSFSSRHFSQHVMSVTSVKMPRR